MNVLSIRKSKFELKLGDVIKKQMIENMMECRHRFCDDFDEKRKDFVITEEDVQIKLKEAESD